MFTVVLVKHDSATFRTQDAIPMSQGADVKLDRRSFLKSICRAKSVLFFIVCFSALLSYGVDERDYRNLSSSVAIVYNDKTIISGTGFFITKNLLVTNYHVVEELAHVTDQSMYAKIITQRKMKDLGKVLAVDIQNDLAIIKTLRNDYTPLTLGSDRDIIRGEGSFIIGYPRFDPTQQTEGVRFKELPFHTYPGIKESIKVALSEGFIGMRIGNEQFYTTSLTTKGASGSPVFSQDLKVIGVVTALAEYTNPQQTVVIPIHKLKNLIERNREFLQKEGSVIHISPELVKRRALHADIKTARDIFFLGHYYLGRGTEKDFQKARYWYEKAAQQGHSRAQYDLALMYYEGLGVEGDLQKACYWYEKAAQQGHKWAQYNLALMYYEGLGVGRDFQKAFKLFEAAAEQGHVRAQYNLAIMYYRGDRGVERDLKEARYWFEKAAEQGHKKAQYSFAIMYAKGQGVNCF